MLEKRKYSYTSLLRELRSNEPADFENYSHMENRTFYELFNSNFVVHTKSAKVIPSAAVNIFSATKTSLEKDQIFTFNICSFVVSMAFDLYDDVSTNSPANVSMFLFDRVFNKKSLPINHFAYNGILITKLFFILDETAPVGRELTAKRFLRCLKFTRLFLHFV